MVGWLVGGVSFDIPVRCTGGLSWRRCCKYLLYLLLLMLWIILLIYFVFHFCISHFTFYFSFFSVVFLFCFSSFFHLTNPDSPVFPNQPTNQPTFPPGARPCLFTAAAAPTRNFSHPSGCHPPTPCGSQPHPSLDPNRPVQHSLPAPLRHNTHKELQMLSCENDRTIVVPFEN